jgi:hypothetical protein
MCFRINSICQVTTSRCCDGWLRLLLDRGFGIASVPIIRECTSVCGHSRLSGMRRPVSSGMRYAPNDRRARSTRERRPARKDYHCGEEWQQDFQRALADHRFGLGRPHQPLQPRVRMEGWRQRRPSSNVRNPQQGKRNQKKEKTFDSYRPSQDSNARRKLRRLSQRLLALSHVLDHIAQE